MVRGWNTRFYKFRCVAFNGNWFLIGAYVMKPNIFYNSV